ncbi:not available [Campylobacter jejuni]|nr:not available [Campylobacter jejuni]
MFSFFTFLKKYMFFVSLSSIKMKSLKIIFKLF